MRQIKFRFFDLEIQQYRIDGQIQISSSGDPFVIYPLEDKTGFLFEKIENIVIEQFTGLTDKNGKEIYEGDIVQKMEEDWLATDEWTDEDFREKEIPFKITKTDYVDLNRFRFWLKNETFGYEGENLEYWENWEVIGNIHEHTHLLNN